MTLIGRFSIPFDGLGLIFIYTSSIVVKVTQITLPSSVPLFDRFSVP